MTTTALELAAAHKGGVAGVLIALGLGLVSGSVVLGIGAASPNGRLKNSPQLRKPFGIAAGIAFVVGVVLLIVGFVS